MKKKIVLMLLVCVMVFCCSSTSVFARNISSCDTLISTNILIDEKIPSTVSTIVTVIKIVVPILLVIFGMIDLFKGIMAQKEDEIKKGQQIFIKRLIAGAIVFFVFVIVQFLISLVADDEDGNIMSCARCFINDECCYRDEETCEFKLEEKTKQK